VNSRLRIIVTGLIAQHPSLPGVAWDYVQYVAGLSRLGHDAFYIEDSGEWPYLLSKPEGQADWIAPDCTQNLRHLVGVMKRFGLADRWAYRFPRDGEWFGLSTARRSEILASADLVLNVSGTIARPIKYAAAQRLAYIDSDPVFTQIRALCDAKFRARILRHDVHFSFGESHSPEVPPTGQHWQATRQPIFISEWRPNQAFRPVFTTVMSWASYKPLTYQGRRYRQKDVQFRRCIGLPQRVPTASFEIALGDMDHSEWQSADDPPPVGTTVAEALRRSGWSVVSASEACPDVDGYKAYIEGSMAEWSVAKHGYVTGQPGWFSCRSACYLAAGRPVVVEHTGFDRVLPVGEGILPFRSENEAVVAVDEVCAHYSRHAEAARDIAATWFDSDKVLTSLVDRAMSSSPVRQAPTRKEDAAGPPAREETRCHL
jgi:hypothetical protein